MATSSLPSSYSSSPLITFKLLLTSLTNSILPSILNPSMNLLNAEIYNLPHLLNAEIYNLPHLLNAETSTNPLNVKVQDKYLNPSDPHFNLFKSVQLHALTQPFPYPRPFNQNYSNSSRYVYSPHQITYKN